MTPSGRSILRSTVQKLRIWGAVSTIGAGGLTVGWVASHVVLGGDADAGARSSAVVQRIAADGTVLPASDLPAPTRVPLWKGVLAPQPLPLPSGATAGTGTIAALRPWAIQISARTAVPVVAVQAYGNATLTVNKELPGCHLGWTTLAGIGRVESSHGQFAGATLNADGTSSRPIIGVPLDGSPGVAGLADSDNGTLDGDTTWDHAVGPMQFIPRTWQRYGADGDGDGRKNPFDIYDAALAAGRYLCAAGGDLSQPTGWQNAILAYNASSSYVAHVFEAADGYARSAS